MKKSTIRKAFGRRKEDLESKRTSDWFSAFVGATTEKIEIAKFLEKLIKLFVEGLPETSLKGMQCSVMDVGMGEGTLAGKIAQTLKDHCFYVDYRGIDRDGQFVAQTRAKLAYIKVDEQRIIEGDCFSQDLDQLPNNPSLVVVSHVAYYTPDVRGFIKSLVQKMGKDTILVFVHAPMASDHMCLRQEYGAAMNMDVTKTIKEAIETQQSPPLFLETQQEPILSLWNLFFTSFLSFPESVSFEDLSRITSAAYENIKEEHELTIRNLLEFIVQRPMEALREEKILGAYVEKMTKTLCREVNKFHIWTNMQIVVSRDSGFYNMVKTAVHDLIRHSDSEGFSALHIAAQKGRLPIIECLVEQGIIGINALNFNTITPLAMLALGSKNVVSSEETYEEYKRNVCFFIERGASEFALKTACGIFYFYTHEAVAEYIWIRLGKPLDKIQDSRFGSNKLEKHNMHNYCSVHHIQYHIILNNREDPNALQSGLKWLSQKAHPLVTQTHERRLDRGSCVAQTNHVLCTMMHTPQIFSGVSTTRQRDDLLCSPVLLSENSLFNRGPMQQLSAVNSVEDSIIVLLKWFKEENPVCLEETFLKTTDASKCLINAVELGFSRVLEWMHSETGLDVFYDHISYIFNRIGTKRFRSTKKENQLTITYLILGECADREEIIGKERRGSLIVGRSFKRERKKDFFESLNSLVLESNWHVEGDLIRLIEYRYETSYGVYAGVSEGEHNKKEEMLEVDMLLPLKLRGTDALVTKATIVDKIDNNPAKVTQFVERRSNCYCDALNAENDIQERSMLETELTIVYKNKNGFAQWVNIVIGSTNPQLGIGIEHLSPVEQCPISICGQNSEVIQPQIRYSSGLIEDVTDDFGDMYRPRVQYEETDLCYAQSLDGKKIVSDYSEILTSLCRAGDVFRDKREFDRAQEYYVRALRIATVLKHKPMIAVSLCTVGDTFRGKGEFDEALEHYKEALKIRREIYGNMRNPDVGVSLCCIGDIYREQKKFDEALKYYKEALEIRREIYGEIENPEIAVSLCCIGDVHNGQKNFDEALRYYERALKIREKEYGLMGHLDIAVSLGAIGNAYSGKGNYNMALNYYSKASSVCEKYAHSDVIMYQALMRETEKRMYSNFQGRLFNCFHNLMNAENARFYIRCLSYKDEILKFRTILQKYQIDMIWQEALLPRNFNKVVAVKIHPDKGGGKGDFVFAQNLKAKFEQEIDVKSIVDGQIRKWQPRVHKVSVALKGVDLALDGLKLFQEPTSDNAEKTGASFVYWYSMYTDFDQLSLGMNALLIARTYEKEGLYPAMKQGAMSMFMMLPTVLANTYPYASFACSLALKTHIGYNVVSKARVAYQEYGTDAQQLKSYTAWKDVAEWLADNTEVEFFSSKAQEYDLTLNAIKISTQRSSLQEKLKAENGEEFGNKLYEYIHNPFLEAKLKLLDAVTLGMLSQKEAEAALKTRLAAIPERGYDICLKDDTAGPNTETTYYCSYQADQSVHRLSVSGGGLEVNEIL